MCSSLPRRRSLRAACANTKEEKEEEERIVSRSRRTRLFPGQPPLNHPSGPGGRWCAGWRCATPAHGRASVRARSYINKRSAERRHQKKRCRGTGIPLCRAYPTLVLQRILTTTPESGAAALFRRVQGFPRARARARDRRLENRHAYRCCIDR